MAAVTGITAGTEEEDRGRTNAEVTKTMAAVNVDIVTVKTTVDTETVRTAGRNRVTITHTSKGQEETTDLRVWL